MTLRPSEPSLLDGARPRQYDESPNILQDGRWVRRGLVLVWEPVGDPEPEPEREAVCIDGVEFLELIACVQCGATASEHCRSASGRRANDPHASRKIKRTCGCLSPLAPGYRYCPPCRARSDAERKRLWDEKAREAA